MNFTPMLNSHGPQPPVCGPGVGGRCFTQWPLRLAHWPKIVLDQENVRLPVQP